MVSLSVHHALELRVIVFKPAAVHNGDDIEGSTIDCLVVSTVGLVPVTVLTIIQIIYLFLQSTSIDPSKLCSGS